MRYSEFTEQQIRIMIGTRALYWQKESKRYFKFLDRYNVIMKIAMNPVAPALKPTIMFLYLKYIQIILGKKVALKYVNADMLFWIRWFRFKMNRVLEEISDTRDFVRKNRAILPNIDFKVDLDLKITRMTRTK